MIVIMGATGQTGGVAMRTLAEQGVKVRGITRDVRKGSTNLPEGAKFVAADIMNVEKLSAAFEGAEAVYAMLPPLTQADDTISVSHDAARTVVKALARAKVRRVVALSSGGAQLVNGTGAIRTLYDFEQALTTLDAHVTLIRAADFMENWASVLPLALSAGVLPTGRTPLDGPMETVSIHDIGALAADCLTGPAGTGKIINLLGPVDYTPNDFACAASAILGIPVCAVTSDADTLLAGLIASGIGHDYARCLLEVYIGLNAGTIGFELGIGETRRGSTTVTQALTLSLKNLGLLSV